MGGSVILEIGDAGSALELVTLLAVLYGEHADVFFVNFDVSALICVL